MEKQNKRIRHIGIYSIGDLKSHYENKTKGYWFTPDTMRFFRTRISDTLFYGTQFIYFVTSEKASNQNRLYSVRSYDPKNGDIETVGDFQDHTSSYQAKKIAQDLVKKEWG